jgi:septum formation inhibitor-activating ATPase MinD
VLVGASKWTARWRVLPALCVLTLRPRCSSRRNQDRIVQLKEQKGQLIQQKRNQEIKLTKFMHQLVSERIDLCVNSILSADLSDT